MKELIKGKTVLVTGGTGSFGHYIVSAMLKHGPRQVRVYSRDEKKQDDMRYWFNNDPRLRFVIGDVRNRQTLTAASAGVDLLFHAAALKQVPSCQHNVMEAVLTNAMGAANVIEACIRNKIPEVVAISTDKAVKPVNVMGMTKALQEKLFINANIRPDAANTEFQIVRYGNVLGSRGSVIPLFKKQLQAGKPLTITEPGMTRFIITLKEAIGLVFTAMHQGVGGEIFVLKSKALGIGDLAEVMSSAAGQKSKARYTGMRSGEKMHEILISEEESLRTLERESHFIVVPEERNEKTTRRYRSAKFASKPFEYSSQTVDRMSKAEIKNLLMREGWLKPGRGSEEH
jgi:UDP-N-acetylglucosamine 4,6-dehydratase